MRQNNADLPVIDVPWCHREEPLPVVAAVALDDHKAALESFLRSSTATDLQSIRSQRCLLVFAPFDQLPWFPGVVYVGPTHEDPQLLVPSNLRPKFAAEHLYAALRKTFGNGRLCILPKESLIVNCSSVVWTVPSNMPSTESHDE